MAFQSGMMYILKHMFTISTIKKAARNSTKSEDPKVIRDKVNAEVISKGP